MTVGNSVHSQILSRGNIIHIQKLNLLMVVKLYVIRRVHSCAWYPQKLVNSCLNDVGHCIFICAFVYGYARKIVCMQTLTQLWVNFQVSAEEWNQTKHIHAAGNKLSLILYVCEHGCMCMCFLVLHLSAKGDQCMCVSTVKLWSINSIGTSYCNEAWCSKC